MTNEERLSNDYSDLKEKHILLLGRLTDRDVQLKAKNEEIQKLLEIIEQYGDGKPLNLSKVNGGTGQYVTLKKYQKQVKMTEMYIARCQNLEEALTNRLKV